jgi:hypothetical protein
MNLFCLRHEGGQRYNIEFGEFNTVAQLDMHNRLRWDATSTIASGMQYTLAITIDW